MSPTPVTLEPWSDGDFPLLVAGNTPEMTAHLGGPESDEQLAARHARYLRLQQSGEAHVYRIERDGEPVGSIGWWDSEWDEREIHETGWFTVPSAQRSGVASGALALVIADVRAHGRFDRLYAFPDRGNAASNALCSRLGFVLDEEPRAVEFRGATLHVNPWYLPL
jgi:RimJ/RimL family protein N-acetyltransferase